MTHDHDDDAAKLAEPGRALPAIDVDATSADRIIRSARRHVGRGPSLVRLIEPAIAAALVTSYLVWAIARVFEALR
jgi:hypothetical protein